MKLRRHAVISVLVPLLVLISTIVSPVAATTYKEMSTVHTLVESGFSTRVTLSGNSHNYAVAWDTTGAVHGGLCPRDELESRHGIPFSKEFDYSAPGGWENPAVPSILLLDDGTICMLLKMRPTPSEEQPSLVFVKSSNNGTSWSAPVVVTPALIINGTSRDSLRNPFLFEFNSTHLIAMWADARDVVVNGMYSIMYSLSGNNGTDWTAPVALFENCTNHFNAIKTRSEKLLISMVFEKAEYRPGKTVTPYNIYYVEVPTNGSAINSTEPQSLYRDTNTLPCYMDQFDNGDFLLTVTENLVLSYMTTGTYSSLYKIDDALAYSFAGLYMVGPSTAICFFNHDSKCKFVYLDHFIETANGGGLTNEQILLIVIAVVIGVQVGLCAVHDIKKRRARRGKNTPEPATGLDASPKQEPPENGSTDAKTKIEPPTSTGSEDKQDKQEPAKRTKQGTLTNDRSVHEEKTTAMKQD